MTGNTAETTAESPAVGSEVIVEQGGANGGMTRATIAKVLKARVVLEDGHWERFTAAASTRRACSSTAARSAGTVRARIAGVSPMPLHGTARRDWLVAPQPPRLFNPSAATHRRGQGVKRIGAGPTRKERRGDTQQTRAFARRHRAHGYDHKRPLTAVEMRMNTGRRTQCSPVNTGLDCG